MHDQSHKIQGPPVIKLATFLRHVFVYVRPYRLQSLLLIVGMLLDLLFDTALRLSFKFLIDEALMPQNYALLLSLLVGLSGGIVIAASAAVGRDYLYARLGTRIVNDLRTALFTHLQGLSMPFYSRTPTGEIMARFATDLAAVEYALVQGLPIGLFAVLGLVLAVVPLFLLAWHLALLAVATLPLCLLGPRLLEKHAFAASYRLKEAQANVANAVQENVSAQPVVKAFSLQGTALEGFQHQMTTLTTLGTRANFLSYLMERTPNITVLFLQLLIIAEGAYLVFDGRLSVGALVAFHVLFVSVSQSVYSLTWTLPGLVQATGGLQRIEELLQTAPQVTDSPDASRLPRLRQVIALHQVTFGYTAASPILTNVSLTMQQGHFIAFVGPSGSGKSTILNLLMRFYDPTQGTVTFDGVDIRTVTQDSLRAHMGVVFQENCLFNISIRENIRLSRLEASDAEVEAAARAAEIHDIITNFPQGYDTLVGERGGRLSGGQRQRIAIARALLRDPAILLLDEATSALDPATEAAINATLRRVGRGRTVISVTHRLSTVTHADHILVLRGGEVVEQGRHEELLQQDGTYAELWHKQSHITFSAGWERAQVSVEHLRRLPILENLDDVFLAEVAALFVTEQYPQDRIVVHEGDPGERFYIIAHGTVSVLKDDAAGLQRQIRVLEDGDYFGEAALLRNAPRTATVRTVSPCVFLSLQREQFTYLLSQVQHLRATLEQLFQERLDEQDALLANDSGR